MPEAPQFDFGMPMDQAGPGEADIDFSKRNAQRDDLLFRDFYDFLKSALFFREKNHQTEENGVPRKNNAFFFKPFNPFEPNKLRQEPVFYD